MPLFNVLNSTFPTYILPTIPFRRRSSASTTASAQSSASAASSASSASSNSSVTAAPAEPYLSTHASLLRCSRCLAHLASEDQIVSKGFTGRHGRAYLVASPPSPSPSPSPSSPSSSAAPGAREAAARTLPNTTLGRAQQRQLVTGLHTVCDVACARCGCVLGWKYVAAAEEGQRYKVGKFILETKRVLRDAVWEDTAGAVGAACAQDGVKKVNAEEEEAAVEFDSQDEEECEDLFMGIWSEKLALKRRRDKAWRTAG